MKEIIEQLDRANLAREIAEREWILYNRNLGHEMRKKRKAYEVSIGKVALRLGVTAAYIFELEIGSMNWNEEIILDYCAALKGEERSK